MNLSIALFLNTFSMGNMYLTFYQEQGQYPPTILKNILCLLLQDFVKLNASKLHHNHMI